MNGRADIDTYESPRSIEPLSQRELMLDIGTVAWFLIAVQALAAGSLVDEAASTAAWSARFVIGGVCVALAVSMLTWVRELDDRRTYRLTSAMVVLAITIEFILSGYGPGAVAGMYVAYTAIAIFCGQFLSPREIVFQLALLTIFSAIVVVLKYDDPLVPHVLARVFALVPVMWGVAFSVYILRQDRARALLDVESYAYGDPLTGLVNLRALRRRAEALLAPRNVRINRPAGVIVLDIDGFRSTNVLRGHRDGDRLLCMIADRLLAEADPLHTVARTGSDEFMVLVENANADEMPALAGRYRTAVRGVVNDLGQWSVALDASVGTAISSPDAATFDDLVSIADSEMYKIKAEHERNPPPIQVRAGADDAPSLADIGRDQPTDGPVPASSTWRDALRWHNRPVQVRYVTTSWSLYVIVVALSLTMPDAEVSNTTAVVALLGFVFAMSLIRYGLPPSTRNWQQVIDVLFAFIAIAMLTYWTGGASSPAWPTTLLVLIYIGWFMDLRSIAPLSVVAATTILLPLIYQDPGELTILDRVGLFGGVGVGIALAMIMFYNHFYLLRAETVTRRLESIDPRTGVHNRREFENRVCHEIDLLSYGDIDALAIVMLDLGDFKTVTAEKGRAVADEMLREVAEALQRASRSEDCVARLGGDEFAIILPGVNADSARRLAKRFIQAVDDRIADGDLPTGVHISPSAGFALYGMHGRTLEELVTAADVALTAAKTSGRGGDRVSSFVVSL